jgi:O-antigen ligase
MKALNNFALFFLCIIPLSLIIGPAIADININILSIIFLLSCITLRNGEYFKNNYFLFFLLTCFYFIFTSLISIDPLYSLESSLFYFRFGLFVLAVIYILDNDQYSIKYFSLIIICITFLVSFDAIIEYFSYYSFINLFIEKNYSTSGRISGLFKDEFILGSYLVRLLPLSIGLIYFLKIKKNLKKSIIFIYIFFISIAVFISGERTAIFMLLMFYCFTFLVFKKINREYLISLIIIPLIGFILLSSNPNFHNRIIQKTYTDIISKIEKNSVNVYKINFFSIQHEVVFKTSIKIFNDNKYFGIGPKMFRVLCNNKKYYTYSEQDRSINGCQSHPHNTYIQILTETGIFGFFIFSFLYLFFFANFLKLIFFKQLNLNEPITLLNIFCNISIVINFWPIFPTGNFFNNWLSIVYYLPISFYFYSLNKMKL